MRGTVSILLRVTAMASAALALPAQAQDASNPNGGTWSLPSGASTPSAQGPTDPQNPVVRPRQNAPAPAPATAAPTAVPTIAAPPPPPSATSATPTPRPIASPSARPTAELPSTQPAPVPTSAAPEAPSPASPAATPTPEPVPTETGDIAAAAVPATEHSDSNPSWWPIAAGVLVLIALGIAAVLWTRRGRKAAEAPEADWPAEEPVSPVTAPETVAPVLSAAPVKPVPAPPSPGFATVDAIDDVTLAIEPVSLRLSLVYATLQLRVTLTAAADRPAGQLLGDMISAHASLPQDQQLSPDLAMLVRLKPVAAMAAGESQLLTTEVQLPLNAIRPLMRGTASYLVPLVRLVLATEGRQPVRRVVTVGATGGAALAPLRLDTGPRTFDALGAREIEAARTLSSADRRIAG